MKLKSYLTQPKPNFQQTHENPSFYKPHQADISKSWDILKISIFPFSSPHGANILKIALNYCTRRQTFWLLFLPKKLKAKNVSDAHFLHQKEAVKTF